MPRLGRAGGGDLADRPIRRPALPSAPGGRRPLSASDQHGESRVKPGYHNAEAEHLADTGSGVIRASVFGMSDGLVSNLALVMGVAGGTSSSEPVVLAGTAGLLAGAFSMAAGEYVSVQTQREAMQKQLELERDHLERFPEEEEAHLRDLLAENGLDKSAAAEIAAALHQSVEPALDFHALLELGIVPNQMGSAIGAALASFASFTAGALIPLIPFLVTDDAIWPSVIASALSLLLVGGAVTRITNRNALTGALRQLAFGLGAAGITFAVGRMVGSAIAL